MYGITQNLQYQSNNYENVRFDNFGFIPVPAACMREWGL